MKTLYWFTRDHRISDNPALLAAGTEIYPVVLAEALHGLSEIRRESLLGSWVSLNDALNQTLSMVEDIAVTAKALHVTEVHASRLYDPEGIALQGRVAKELASCGITLVLGGGNYAVSPGVVRKGDGTPYRVYTPFYRAWLEVGWVKPFPSPQGVTWLSAGGATIPESSKIRAGEAYALETLRKFRMRAIDDYTENRNRADLSGTSHLSHALAHGEIHPRTILNLLGETGGEITFAKEIAWREFYADVLFHNPHTVEGYYEPRFEKMRYDFDESKFAAWCQGKTGYPMVDAGMRQLVTTGWMHNRVRMIVASFLVKDLHIEWQHGARWFESHLTDFDVASNSHGWQWTAGCGTDASPYYRVFNPTSQGYKFDPNGEYVRKYIPELAHIDGAAVHEPWELIDGYVGGYPSPIVDHALERNESLARLEELKLL